MAANTPATPGLGTPGTGAGASQGSGRADSGKRSRRRRRLKIAVAAAGTLAAVLVVCVALAPAIAQRLVPGIVVIKADGRKTGEVRLDAVSFSWGGPQKFGQVRVLDLAGKTVADVSVNADFALWPAATGFLTGGGVDLGTTTIAGQADIVVDADGTTNLQRIFARGTPAPAPAPAPGASRPGGGSIPPGLKARVVIDRLDVTVDDPAGALTSAGAAGGLGAFGTRRVSGEVNVDPSGTATLSLASQFVAGASVADLRDTGGRLSIRAEVRNFADARGRPTPANASFDATIEATALPVPLADALARQQGRLARALGATLDATVTAKGDLKNASARLSAKSEALDADVGLSVTDGVATNDGTGRIRLDTTNALALVDGLEESLARQGVSIARMPAVTLTIDALRARLPRDGAPLDLRGAAASVRLETSELSGSLAPEGSDGARPFAVAPLRVSIDTPDLGGGVQVKAATSATLAGRSAGVVDIDLTARDLLDEQGAPRAASGGAIPGTFEGRAELTGLATELAGVFLPATNADGTPAPDLAAVLQSAVGPELGLTLRSVKSGEPGAPLAVSFTAQARNVSARAQAALSEAALEVKGAGLDATLDPAALDAVLAAFAPDLSPRPRLAAPAGGPGRLSLSLSPATIPLAPGARPEFDKAGEVTAYVALPGRTVVEGLAVAGDPGTGAPERPLGPVGIEDFKGNVKLPLAALGGGAAQRATWQFSGAVLGDAGQSVATISAKGGVAVREGKQAGPATLDVALNAIDTAWLDRLAGRPGLASGAVGPQLNVSAIVTVDAPGPATSGAPARTASAALALSSARLSTPQPLAVRLGADRIELARPGEVKWIMGEAFGTRYVLGVDPAAGQPVPYRFRGDTAATLTVRALALAHGEGVGPLKPGVFALDVGGVIPEASLVLEDGSVARIADVTLAASGTPEPGGVRVELRAGRMGLTDQAATGEGLDAQIRVAGLADPAGTVTPGSTRVNADARAPSIPTAFVDAMARQRGLLPAALGPSVEFSMAARDLSRAGGTLDVRATAPRARAVMKGVVQPPPQPGGTGVFLADDETGLVVTEIRQELLARFASGLPSIASIEKRPEDGPATVTTRGLRLPLGNDLSKLNGEATIDLGTAQFGTSNVFGKILKFVGQRESGRVGQRVEPIHVVMTDGVAKYDRFRLPLGEFTIETVGTVDLVKREVDVITYVPLGALTDEALGIFNSGLGAALGRAVPILEKNTLVPWRTAGPMNNPETKFDARLFAQEAAENLRPGNLLRDVREGLRDRLKGNGG